MEKQNNSVLQTYAESERVIFTFSSSTEQAKWIFCKSWGAVEAHTALAGAACVGLGWQQGQRCLGAAEDPMFSPGVPEPAGISRKVICEGLAGTWQVMDGWTGAGTWRAWAGSRLQLQAFRKETGAILLYCFVVLAPKLSFILLDPGRYFLTSLQYFLSSEGCNTLLCCVSVQ